MSDFRLPPDAREAIRRALALSSEQREAMRRAAMIPREQLEAMRRAVAVSSEQLEAMRRAAMIPREQLEAMRRAVVAVPAEQLEAMRRTVSVSPEQLEVMRRAAMIPREQLEAMRRAVSVPPEQLEAMRRLTHIQLPDLTASLRESFREVVRHFREAWEQSMPPNWSGMDTEEVMSVIERVRATGYTLVWLPRAEILREVLAADSADTGRVLLARSDDVLEDAVLLLAEITDPDLVIIREAVEEAIAAFRNGHPRASQALASSAFTSEVHEFFEMGTTASRKRMEQKDPNEVGLRELRLTTIFQAGAKALAEFRPDSGRPVRKEFNRHNTAHRITSEQWTEANALSAIMLATSLLREMQHWYDADRDAAA